MSKSCRKTYYNFALPIVMIVILIIIAAVFGKKGSNKQNEGSPLALQKIASGFKRPLQVVFPPGNANSMYVVEQRGRIYRISQNKKTLFLNISKSVRSKGNEEGLLSLAFAPDYKEDKSGSAYGRFYLNYTAGSPSHTVIAEFTIKKGVTPKALLRKKRVLLRFRQPYSNHNGGMILFGPDNMLYIATGDGGSGGDPLNNGQKKNTLLGKMLRIDPKASKRKAYSIPLDNPFVNQRSYRSEIYAFGLRNPWRFSFDKKTGILYAGDVGQNAQEEIDIIPKGGNMGWRLKEGFLCYDPSTNCDKPGLIDPIHVYNHDEGQSVIGGYVYRGSLLNRYKGHYIFGDFISGTIWNIPLKSNGYPAGKANTLFKNVGLLASFGEDQYGELYFTDFQSGAVYKIVTK